MLITSIVITAISTALITYLIAQKLYSSNALIYIEQAKAKAKAIEFEAEQKLNEEKLKIKEIKIDLEAKDRILKEEMEFYKNKLEGKYQLKSEKLNQEKLKLEEEKERIAMMKNSINAMKNEKEEEIAKYQSASEEIIHALSNYTGLTIDEAKEILLKNLEENLTKEKAMLIRRYEAEARAEARKKANYIIAQATTRFAGEFANERLINVIHLPNDELKGRIIGKEGRNIKTLEMISGVDIIIDSTPNTIILSSFNLYRRAIATKTLEALIEDGRIQPARIEDVYRKTEMEMEEHLIAEAKEVVLDLGISQIEPEILKLIGKMRYRASYGQNALGHSIEVAKLAGVIAGELGGDVKLAKRAGLLHDIGKALTQEYGGSHVDIGVNIVKKYNEGEVIINTILAHHGHEEPKSIECAAVCTADVLSAGRVGARKEVLENFLNRMQELENIAKSKLGVLSAYAIDAGRELRVIVKSDVLNDKQSAVLSHNIAEEIEQKLQYPGEIKINVIRETREITYAK